jgi:hypothetical protein
MNPALKTLAYARKTRPIKRSVKSHISCHDDRRAL